MQLAQWREHSREQQYIGGDLPGADPSRGRECEGNAEDGHQP